VIQQKRAYVNNFLVMGDNFGDFWFCSFKKAWKKFGYKQYTTKDLQLFMYLLSKRKNYKDESGTAGLL